MNKFLSSVIGLLVAFSPLSKGEGPQKVTVFEAGAEGYKVFRIPAIIEAANGDLLAFCEARRGGDASEIDLVSKRSCDEGKTWGAIEVVQESDDFASLFEDKSIEITIGNPAPVVDQLDTRHPGRIWLPFTLENDRVFVISSDDHGRTWSKRKEITKEVKKDEWGWYATGPVHSIQLEREPYRARLVIPCDHRLGDDGDDRGANGVHAIISDDHGETWKLGALDETYEDGLNANETTVVELNDGSLYFNTRDQNGKAPGTRGEAWSRDGGETFESVSADWKTFRPVGGVLDLPVVQGALLRVSEDLILFSGPDENGPTGKGRSDMRIRYSTDEAKTWQDGPLIHIGPAAYSDMVLIGEEKVGLLFEAGDPGQKNTYQRIEFVSVSPGEADPVSWNHLAPIPDEHGFAGPYAGSIDGTLVVAGGANFPKGFPWEGGDKVWYDKVFVLPGDSREWAVLKLRLPKPLAYGVSLSLPDRNSVVMLGGSDENNSPTTNALELTESEDGFQIKSLPNLPIPLTESSGAALGDHVYVFSGRTTKGTARKAYRLDLSMAEANWEALPWPEGARGRMHSAAGVVDGMLYLIAGRDVMSAGDPLFLEDRMNPESLDFLRDAWKLDSVTLEWSRLSDLPHGLSAAPANAVPNGSELLVLGGVDVGFLNAQLAARPDLNGQGHEHPGFPRTIWAYDTRTDHWRKAGRIPDSISAPVTVPVVSTGEGTFIIPSGEIKPGVRTRQVVVGKIRE